MVYVYGIARKEAPDGSFYALEATTQVRSHLEFDHQSGAIATEHRRLLKIGDCP